MSLWAPQSTSGASSGGGTGDIESVATPAGSGLSGGGESGALSLAVVRGTGVNQTRHGNDAAYTDARTPLPHAHAAADVTSGTFDLARMTAATAGRLLRVNDAGNAIEGGALLRRLGSDVALTTSVTTALFNSFNVVAGRHYYYRAALICSGTQSGAIAFNFGASGGAATTQHFRIAQALNASNNMVFTRSLPNDFSTTTSPNGAVGATGGQPFYCEGWFTPSVSGTLQLQVSPAVSGFVVKSWSTFLVEEVL